MSMGMLRRAVDRFLEIPAVYATWQATHNREKVAFVSSRILPRPGLRVVELACGPGTNAHLFPDCAYTGIDINPQYIESAQRRFPQHTFVCADLTLHDFGAAEYDWVLVNSFLHHLDDTQAHAILTAAGRIKAKGIVVLELVLPSRPSVARLLAKLDRGRFARSLDEWRTLIPPMLHVREQVDVFIRRGGVLLYHLVGYVLEGRGSTRGVVPGATSI